MSLSLGRSMRHASASGLMRQLTLACASNQAPIKSQTTTSNQRHEARHRRSCRLHSSLAACSAPPSRASPASIPPFVSGVTGAQRSSALKAMLKSDKLEFIMEAHSGLSAKIVQGKSKSPQVERRSRPRCDAPQQAALLPHADLNQSPSIKREDRKHRIKSSRLRLTLSNRVTRLVISV